MTTPAARRIDDPGSAIAANLARADALVEDLRSQVLNMTQARDAFAEATYHRAEARRLDALR